MVEGQTRREVISKVKFCNLPLKQTAANDNARRRERKPRGQVTSAARFGVCVRACMCVRSCDPRFNQWEAGVCTMLSLSHLLTRGLSPGCGWMGGWAHTVHKGDLCITGAHVIDNEHSKTWATIAGLKSSLVFHHQDSLLRLRFGLRNLLDYFLLKLKPSNVLFN